MITSPLSMLTIFPIISFLHADHEFIAESRPLRSPAADRSRDWSRSSGPDHQGLALTAARPSRHVSHRFSDSHRPYRPYLSPLQPHLSNSSPFLLFLTLIFLDSHIFLASVFTTPQGPQRLLFYIPQSLTIFKQSPSSVVVSPVPRPGTAIRRSCRFCRTTTAPGRARRGPVTAGRSSVDKTNPSPRSRPLLPTPNTSPPRRTGLWPGVNAWPMTALTAALAGYSPPHFSAAVPGTCQLATGRPCVNGACLDSQCYCNDGFGGKGCEMPGKSSHCVRRVFDRVFDV